MKHVNATKRLLMSLVRNCHLNELTLLELDSGAVRKPHRERV